MASGSYEFRPAASLEYPGDIAGFTRHAIHPSGGSSNRRVGTGAPGVGSDSRIADLCAPFIPIGVSIVPAGAWYPWALDRNACGGGLVRVVGGLAVRAGPDSSRTGNGCPSHIDGKPYFQCTSETRKSAEMAFGFRLLSPGLAGHFFSPLVPSIPRNRWQAPRVLSRRGTRRQHIDCYPQGKQVLVDGGPNLTSATGLWQAPCPPRTAA